MAIEQSQVGLNEQQEVEAERIYKRL